MLRSRHTKEEGSCRGIKLVVTAAALVMLLTCGSVYAKSPDQRIFSSPDEAVKTMADAVKADDTKSLLTIFGPGSKAIIVSGDPVEDREGRAWFVKHYEEKNRLEETSGRVTLHVGSDEWPFPIPIVKAGSGWRFDTLAGKEEILARRVGRNELNAIQVCLAYVDAQKEYAMTKARQGEGLLEYAQRFVSYPARRTVFTGKLGKARSKAPWGLCLPLRGKRVTAEAAWEVNRRLTTAIYYRILKAQGKNAPGGAHDYVVGDKMIGGFALIAYPARYRSSGVMTFIVNQNGVVYQKDLGKKTRRAAHAVKEFDPDQTWVRAPE